MLDRHLTVKTYGTALEENIVLWRDYRVTVLDAGLFRIEKNDKCVWRDKATQSVWYRRNGRLCSLSRPSKIAWLSLPVSC